MRHFSSYGPVESEAHFAVPRIDLVERSVTQLVGQPNEKGGHYFTIWGPRQTGKTWIMRQAMKAIREKYGDRFLVGTLSMQGRLDTSDGEEVFLRCVPGLIEEGFGLTAEQPEQWDDWRALFRKRGGIFNKPLILLIDEFDSLPPKVIDRIGGIFRPWTRTS